MFFNLVNGKTYVGSSVKLDRRFRVHISSIGSVKLPLYNALNKYSLNNFAFLILQYCEPDEEVCLGLEQSYLDLHKPTYNILKLAGSSQGFKHSPDTIAKLKKLHAGKLHPRFGSKASDEQKLLTSLALKKYYKEHAHHSKGKKGKLASQYGVGGTKIIMTNELVAKQKLFHFLQLIVLEYTSELGLLLSHKILIILLLLKELNGL
uniref:GIY-YIG homing endonuclease n=1 Tax=Phanerochaete carnosa TaxID=231932 RepID=A0A895KUT1_9APHY|nr:GIY-YIG homing endonuclease [Phanerochaete carnosa]QRZ60347.1 GIY-YIG homing endonuclease [Phanerochaete carnosa]